MTNKPEGRSEVARDRNVLQLALTGAAPFTRGGDARPTGGNWRDIANFEERRYRTYGVSCSHRIGPRHGGEDIIPPKISIVLESWKF
jgi:hypothetical protein